MVKVVLKDVTKKFGRIVAVNKVSLEVEGGELFTILGPSGCGKKPHSGSWQASSSLMRVGSCLTMSM